MASEHVYLSSATVAAPANRVWELICDTRRYADWGALTLEIPRTDGKAELGCTYYERVALIGPWKAVIRWRVTAFDPPRRQTHTGQVWYARRLESEMACAPDGEHTIFRMTLRSTPRFGRLGAAIERALAPSVQRDWDRTVENLKSLAEHDASHE